MSILCHFKVNKCLLQAEVYKHLLVSRLFSCISPFTTKKLPLYTSAPSSLGPRVTTWIWEYRKQWWQDSVWNLPNLHMKTEQLNGKTKSTDISNKTRWEGILVKSEIQAGEDKSLLVTRPAWCPHLCRGKRRKSEGHLTNLRVRNP